MAALGAASRAAAAPAAAAASPADVLRLDRNESPLGPSPAVRAVLAGSAAALGVYPDPGADPVRRAIARHHDVPPGCVVPACGSVEAIQIAFREFLREGDRVATPAPAFHMLPALAGLVGAILAPVTVSRDGTPDTAGLARAAQAGARVVFLANPHNPTGGAVAESRVRALLDALPAGATLIVDEAYQDYSGGGSMLHLAATHPALIVLRTLSKAHGLPGVRLGWAVASPATAARLARHRLPNGVGTLAEKAIAPALADRAHLDRVVALNARARDILTRGLTRLGWKLFESQSNFVMGEVGPRAPDLARILAGKGIAVHRPPDRPDCLRISTGTLDEMDRVLSEISSAN